MKTCSKCRVPKDENEFPKNKGNKDGLYQYCKACVSERNLKYRRENKEKCAEYCRQWALRNKEKVSADDREEYQNNKESKKRYQREYYHRNKEKCIENTCQWRANNKERMLETHYKYMKNRRETDVNFRLACNLRARLYNALKGKWRAGSAVRDLGCTIDELKGYIESKFQPGMSWDNHSVDGWHIDHIIPLAFFDLTERDQFLRACRYSNLQPLWAEDNLLKGSKVS